MPVERVDKLLCDQGLVATRVQAQKLIAAEAVHIQIASQWQAVKKPSQKFDLTSQFKITAIEELKYASRAGLKLEAALQWLFTEYPDTKDQFKTALDIGQSTGGFTDCLLEHGIQKVVGVDVGHGQLIDRLRKDERVVCLEGVNARELDLDQLQKYASDGFDLCVMDVSFISQTKILPSVISCLIKGGALITLIKPQFEVGQEALDKNGLVKSNVARNNAINKVEAFIINLGLEIKHLIESPIRGGDGNCEYLLVAIKT